MRLGENNFKKFQALNNRQHYDLEIHSVVYCVYSRKIDGELI